MADGTSTTTGTDAAAEAEAVAAEAANTAATDGDTTEATSPEEVARIRAALTKANKEAETARLKLKAADDAKLSEIDKAKRDADEATQKLAKYERDNLRQKVALDAGLPAKWVGRLQGDTEEELAADAAAILADLNKTKKPDPDPSQGPRQTSKVSGWDAGKAEAKKRFGK